MLLDLKVFRDPLVLLGLKAFRDPLVLLGLKLLPLWTGRAVNFVTSGSGWPFFHSPRGKSGMSHGLNR